MTTFDPTAFYAGALVLILLALVFVLWPFFRRPAVRSQEEFLAERQATNVSSFRDHLAELDVQLARGNVDDAQYQETKAELERSLLNDNAGQEGVKITGINGYKKWYWGLGVIALPVAVVLMYNALGAKNAVVLGDKLAQKNQLEQQWFRTGDAGLEQQLEQISRELVVDLAAYVQENPDDLDTQVIFARESMNVGNYDQAIKTYQVILEQEPEAAQMMAELSQAVFIQSGNRAVPIVGILAERAIQIQPDHVMALGLAGISAFQAADYAKAVNRWERAIALQPADSPNANALVNGIQQAKARLGDTTETASQNTAQNAAQNTAQAEPDSATDSQLTVTVSLGENVPVEPGQAVFIYARAWQGAKIPLAISRISVADLPVTMTLNNAMAMAPGMDLSSAAEVELIARVSLAGTAIAQAGDWQASMGPVVVAESQDKTFDLVIQALYQP